MHFSDIIENLGNNHIFFWSVNYANLVFKLFIAIWKCQDAQKFFIFQSI